MRRCAGSVQYRSKSGIHVLDHAGYTVPTRQHEPDHTDHTDHADQGYIFPETSR